MAIAIVNGHIERIHYVRGYVMITITEFKKGWKKDDGTYVKDNYITWRVAFRNTFRDYINKYFSEGWYVQVIGEIFPYSIRDGKIENGYSLSGKVIELQSYPKRSNKGEMRMIKESIESVEESPDLEGYQEEDF